MDSVRAGLSISACGAAIFRAKLNRPTKSVSSWKSSGINGQRLLAVSTNSELVDADRRRLLRTGSKAKALEAVLAFAPARVTRLAKLKKAEIVEVERLAAGTGWLQVMFRAQAPSPGTQAVPEIEAAEAAAGGRAEVGSEVEDSEEMLAVA